MAAGTFNEELNVLVKLLLSGEKEDIINLKVKTILQ